MLKILKNFTLLIVEDNETTLAVLNETFEPLVKNIYLASDGEQALKLYKKNKPDIIIADLGLPKIDGLELSKQIKTINKNQEIVVLTAKEDIDTLKTVIDINISKIHFKPIESIEIILDSLIAVANNLQNEIDANNLKIVTIKKEKEELLLDVIKQISHHWKQPLSIISTLSSSFSYQKEQGIKTSIEEDIKTAKLITRKTQELANILDSIDNIDYENVSIEQIEELIHISNPIIDR